MPPDLAVPAVNIGGDRELGHFRSAEGFEEYLRLYRAGMAALPPFTFQDVATTFGTVRTYRFGGPDGTRCCCCPAATRPPRCTGATCRRCSRTARSTASICSARRVYRCSAAASPAPRTRPSGSTRRSPGSGWTGSICWGVVRRLERDQRRGPSARAGGVAGAAGSGADLRPVADHDRPGLGADGGAGGARRCAAGPCAGSPAGRSSRTPSRWPH